MGQLNRRHALLSIAAASSLVSSSQAVAQGAASTEGREIAPGVRRVDYTKRETMIPNYKTVSMRDIIVQPGAKTVSPPMMNAMVCHITQGELKVTQDGQEFVAKKDHVWTCAKGTTTEGATNTGTTVAIMRITDLLET